MFRTGVQMANSCSASYFYGDDDEMCFHLVLKRWAQRTVLGSNQAQHVPFNKFLGESDHCLVLLIGFHAISKHETYAWEQLVREGGCDIYIMCFCIPYGHLIRNIKRFSWHWLCVCGAGKGGWMFSITKCQWIDCVWKYWTVMKTFIFKFIPMP